MSKVEVLCPTGHRVCINVSQTTKIIKVLEETCLRKGFMPYYDYEVRHGRKTLELSASIQEAGLTNLAKLELVKRTKPWAESKVLVQLQNSEGARMQREFMPNISLFDLLENFEEDDGRGGHAKLLHHKEKMQHPVVIYVKEEIIGWFALKETTLKTLGVLSGRVLLRHVFREVSQEMLKDIESEIERERTRFNKLREKLFEQNAKEEERPVSATLDSSSDDREVASCHATSDTLNSHHATLNKSVIHEQLETPTSQEITNHQPTTTKGITRGLEDYVMDYQPHQFLDFKFPVETEGKDVYHNEFSDVKKEEFQPCDRELTAFVLDEQMSVDDDDIEGELPDNFFEVTETDLVVLQRDLERNVKQFSEQPLMTQAMRQAELEERMSKYSRVVIRVQFPNRLVVQVVFRPRETVHALYKFVGGLLEDESSFELYTSPPKKVLEDMTQTLIEANLAPMTRLYFGSIPKSADSSLNVEVVSRVSSRSDAERIVSKYLLTQHSSEPSKKKAKDFVEMPALHKRIPPQSNQGKSAAPKWLQLSKK